MWKHTQKNTGDYLEAQQSRASDVKPYYYAYELSLYAVNETMQRQIIFLQISWLDRKEKNYSLGREGNATLEKSMIDRPGTHCAHSIPVCIDGHPGIGSFFASAITAARLCVLWTRIHIKAAIESKKRSPLKRATYIIHVKNCHICSLIKNYQRA